MYNMVRRVARGGKRKMMGRRRRIFRRRRAVRRTGSAWIKRRIPLCSISAGTTSPGIFSTNNATVVTLGTAVASQTLGANYYDVPFAMTVQLDQLAGYTEITTLADRYKIARVAIKFLNNQNAYFAGTVQPFLQLCVDRDDNTAPTIAQLNEKMGLISRTFTSNGYVNFSVRPLPALSAYQSAIATAYTVPNKAPYFNSSYPSVPHYCLKGVIRNVYAPGGGSMATPSLHMDTVVSLHIKDFQ